MERITRFRVMVLLLAVVLVLALYSIKLYGTQVADAAQNGDNTTTYIMRTRVRAARGDLLDTNGNKLVTNRASYDLHLNHYVMLKADNTNDRLLSLVRLFEEMGETHIDHFPVTLQEPFAYTLQEQTATWQGYFQKFLINRDNMDSDISAPLLIEQLRKSYRIPEEWSNADARKVIGLRYELTLRNGVTNLPTFVLLEDASEQLLTAVLALDVPGLTVEPSAVREYSTEYAAHILGYIGAMSPSQWEKYKEVDGYAMDALVGQSGLELAFEEYLHGVDGIRIDKVTKDGVVVNSYYEVEPKSGSNVEISIDLLLQTAAEDKLAEILENRRDPELNVSGKGLDTEGGAVVALDAKTGQVLACASYPTYDLATLFENYDEIEAGKYNPLLNRALMATYAPGSTYKVSMLVAGVDSGTVDAAYTMYDSGKYVKYPGYSPKCHKLSGHGLVNGVDAIKVSCNCYFYELADRMEIDDIDRTAKGLGLGELSGVELREAQGSRANPESKAEAYPNPDTAGWYPADQLMTGIGQSLNEFTPIQLASYASALANSGTRYRATFLSRVVSADYKSLVFENKAQVLSTIQISQQARQMYMEGMLKVAHESGGTAYSTFANYPIQVAAKTGTAEHAYGTPNGAFICFAPADDPQIAIAVYGEKVGGGSYLAPIAKAMLDAYFGLVTGDVDSFENQIS